MNTYIYICKDVFYLLRWDWIWPAKEFRLRRIAQYDLLREELLVLNARAIFCWFLFFAGIETNGLKSHSRIANTIVNHSHTPSQPRAFLLEQLRRGGRSQSGKRRRSGWGLLSQWRPDRSMRISVRGKSKWRGRSWLDCIIYHTSFLYSYFLMFGG